MAQRKRFRTATLVGSTNPLKAIQAKRLEMSVRITSGIYPSVLSMTAVGIRKGGFGSL